MTSAACHGLPPRLTGEGREPTAAEHDALSAQGNVFDVGGRLELIGPCDLSLIRNCRIMGHVRLAGLAPGWIEREGIRLPQGLDGCILGDCDLGENVALHRVDLLHRAVLGPGVLMLGVGELVTTDAARFGWGVSPDGKGEPPRLDLWNENGARGVLAFLGMRTADAWLWARHRDRPELLARLAAMTRAAFDALPHRWTALGAGATVRQVRLVRDAHIGPHASLIGAESIDDTTLLSTAEAPARIGSGAELAGVLADTGARVDSGARLHRVALGQNVKVELGARAVHSFIGDNSTFACGEMVSALVFPCHEQHHNNSFLIASCIEGQSNMAAGVTLGSNHNSRAADGEVVAGRGFWPGLCASFKHNSRFAPFTLVAKGDYPAEINLPLPFCLVAQDVARDRLLLMPAYWMLHNMYALERNGAKFRARDRRPEPGQRITCEPLAPDTAHAILRALALLEEWTGAALADGTPEAGRTALEGNPAALADIELTAPGIENSRRPCIVLKPAAAWHAYRQMAREAALRWIVADMQARGIASPLDWQPAVAAPESWINAGGQVVPASLVEALMQDVEQGEAATWDAVHATFDAVGAGETALWAACGFDVLRRIEGWTAEPDADDWRGAFEVACATTHWIADQVCRSREKDDTHPFRGITFNSPEEMQAVLGSAGENNFVQEATETAGTRIGAFRAALAALA